MYLQAVAEFHCAGNWATHAIQRQASITARWHSRTIRIKFRGVRRSLRQAVLADFTKKLQKFWFPIPREVFVAVAGLEEKYDAVRQLIAVGKERGYLLYDEVNDSLPAEVNSSEEIDDLLTTFERNGIEIYEDAASAKAARAVEVSSDHSDRDAVAKDDGHAEEGSDLDLTPGSLEKTNDPVRMYLREMGTVPLLTREGEVTIAKRIERGQLVVMKAITRSPI